MLLPYVETKSETYLPTTPAKPTLDKILLRLLSRMFVFSLSGALLNLFLGGAICSISGTILNRALLYDPDHAAISSYLTKGAITFCTMCSVNLFSLIGVLTIKRRDKDSVLSRALLYASGYAVACAISGGINGILLSHFLITQSRPLGPNLWLVWTSYGIVLGYLLGLAFGAVRGTCLKNQ